MKMHIILARSYFIQCQLQILHITEIFAAFFSEDLLDQDSALAFRKLLSAVGCRSGTVFILRWPQY